MQLLEVFDFFYSFSVLVNLFFGLEVGVSRALIDRVSDLSAADTADVLKPFKPFLRLVLIMVYVKLVIFVFVLGELAARLVFALLAAAPPHLAAVLTLVRAA
jgi:hypothetical protein